MKVILLEDVINLGKKGGVKEISDGYARNFLIPKKLARPATADALKKVEELKAQEKIKDEKLIQSLRDKAGLIDRKEFKIIVREKNGKLFGSVSEKEISDELSKAGVKIEQDFINLAAPIKETGRKDIKINFGHGVQANIVIIIEGGKK